MMRRYILIAKVVSTIAVCVCFVVTTGCSDGGATALTYHEATAEVIRNEFIVGTAPSGSGEVLEDPTGWQTITGRFLVEGDVATFPNLMANKPGCGKPSLPNEVVVIGPNKGIKNVMFYLDSKLGSNDPGSIWVHESYTDAKLVELDQTDCRFLTRAFGVRTSHTLMAINSDRTTHNVNIRPHRGIASNKSMPPGSREPYIATAQEKRPFPIVCDIHSWMKTWMIVRDNPYFVVSGDDGSFTIENIPAGIELSYRIWTEPKFYTGKITVKEGDDEREVEVKNGKFSLALQPRENESDPVHDITFVLDGAVLGK